MKLKKNEKGEIVMSEEEFSQAITDTAKEAVDTLIKEKGLDKPAPIPSAPAPANEDPKKLAIEVAGESIGQKRIRLAKAIIEVKGGRLRVEDAPKEIKLIRFIKALLSKDHETVIALGDASWGESKALSEGSATDGGNLVPVEFGTDLIVAIEQYGVVRRDFTTVPMKSNEIDLRTVTTKPTIARKGELVASDEAGTKFGKPVLTCDMYTGTQILSREVLDDNNVGLYQSLLGLFAEQFGKAEDTEGLVGTYYPGILGDMTNVTKTTLPAGDTFDLVTYKQLVACKNSLSKGALAGGGKWYMHRTIFGLFEGMEDGGGRPISTNPFGQMPATLLGYPVELSEVMPAVSATAVDKGFIIFGNLKWGYFGDRAGIFTQLLREATMPKAGGGSVNLASERAVALAMDIRWGLEIAQPSYIACIKTSA